MRSSGILMHITSLPGPYGVGTLGKPACAFVDFLKKAGQQFWQVLPVSPTGYGDSPYQSCSAYAGNHYLIDLEALVSMGLLERGEPESVCWCDREDRVDYSRLYENRLAVLRRGFARFDKWEDLEVFSRKNSHWLPDYALFMALKAENGGKPWYCWEKGLKHRKPEAIRQAAQRLENEIRFYSFVQYLFFNQWQALRAYARENGVQILGDVPIYVPMDSVEVWVAPELFQLDEELTPVVVAGCPPDAFSRDGQLWGNPLYCWETMAADGYRWWISRLQAAGALYDVIRLDHFRGFASYWAVPYGDTTARGGRWVKGPGLEFLQTVQRELPKLRLIAEDLGFLTPEVPALRDAAGLPGMKVLGFAFDPEELSDHLPHTYVKNTVCYTGTHDNMTARQWLETASPASVNYARDYMNLSEQEGLVWGVIRTAMASVSDLCIIPMQDYLELGGEARMNFPGIPYGNWKWRAIPDSYGEALAERICKLTCLYGRLAQALDRSGE